jgi:antirestriction protein ArdC
MNRTDITEKMVASLEQDRIPWRSPIAKIAHRNLFSKKNYRGINQFLLSMNIDASPYWATFAQWRNAGCGVRKGEKASQVVYFTIRERVKDDDEDVVYYPVMRYYTIFHLGQVNDPDGKFRDLLDATIETDFETADRIIRASGADIRIGGNDAFYSPQENYIRIPSSGQFESEEERIATLLHELAHWGERNIIAYQRPGKDERAEYAFGELVAEMTACFLCRACGVPSDIKNHESYIGYWLKAMKNDPAYIFQASKMASQIADGILERAGINVNEEAEACIA